MKKKRNTNSVTRQPLLKNMSIIGTTLMISSSVLIPGVTTKAHADTVKNQTESLDHQSQETDESDKTNMMTLNSLEAIPLVKEQSNQFDLALNLTSRSVENNEVTIQMSPNISLVTDDSKQHVEDETGKVIGTYTIDQQLNKIKITFTDTGFTQAKLVVPASIKKFDLDEQVITASIGESMRSKTIITEKDELNTPIEEEKDDQDEMINQDVDIPSEEDETKNPIIDEETAEKEITDEKEPEEDSAIGEEGVSNDIPTNEESNLPEDENEPHSSDETVSDLTEKTPEIADESKESDKEVEQTENSSVGQKDTEDSSVEKEPIIKEKDETANITESAETEKVTEEDEKTEKATEEDKKTEKVTESQSEVQPQLVSLEPMARTVSLLSSKSLFIGEVAHYAQEVANENNLYASVMIAQAILESGYGTSTLSSAPNYNLFGIKGSYNGQSVNMQTWEYFNGQNVTITAQFRKYPSYRQSFEDNANVLKTTSFSPGVYFYSGAWKSNTNSYQDATRWLTGRYATDPNYNMKLNNLILTYNLTQYDTKSSGTTTGNNSSASSGSSGVINTGTTTNNSSSHTVKSGDTLYAIGLKYGVTVSQLKSWNNLTSDTIYIGQKLKVSNSKNSSQPVVSLPNTDKPATAPVNNNNNNSNTQNAANYTVKSGDTLYAIGLKYGVTVAQLKSRNNLTSDTIYVGQKLKVSDSQSSSNTVGSASTNNKPTTTPVNNNNSDSSSLSASTYTVKSGDTLYAIGLKYGVTVSQLKTWNGLTGDTIYIGQRLKLNTNVPVNKPSSNEVSDTNNETTTRYKVKSGDTLYGISSRYGVTVSQLKSWNNLKTDIIYVNQNLTIGAQSTTNKAPQTTSNQATNVSAPSNNNTYIVKSGDTLYRIALNNHVSVNDLKKWNNLTTDLIGIGQKLRIKGTSQASLVNQTTTNYTVKSGDSLYQISLKTGVSVDELKQLNNLSGTMIYVGQTLKVSSNRATTLAQKTGNKSARHSVASGDSLWALANKYGTSVAKIKSLNNLTSNTIYIGQNLRVV